MRLGHVEADSAHGFLGCFDLRMNPFALWLRGDDALPPCWAASSACLRASSHCHASSATGV